MTKAERKGFRDKTDGHCAYCGVLLPEKGWHADHVKPIYRGHDGIDPARRGLDTVANALPACPRCNRWKSVMSVDVFRSEIESQVTRLRRDSAAFRLAEDYGIVCEKDCSVVFYFETEREQKDGAG